MSKDSYIFRCMNVYSKVQRSKYFSVFSKCIQCHNNLLPEIEISNDFKSKMIKLKNLYLFTGHIIQIFNN